MKPKKILHIANRAELSLGKRYYALQYKINNGFVRNGHNVYWFSDRDTAKTSSIIPARKFGQKKCNEKFIEVCRNFKPDVIAFSHADLITTSSIKEVKSFLKDVKIFQYYIDGLYTKSNVDSIISKLDVAEFTFITTAGDALKMISNENSSACFMPNPVDPSIDIHRNFELSKLEYDLLFVAQVGDWLDPYSMRALTLDKFNNSPPVAQIFMSAGIWGNEFISALGQAKMSLNFSQYPPGQSLGSGGNLYLYSSDRISQCLGNGLMTFSDSQCQMSDIYGSKSLVEVANYEEFIDKLYYYLAHDDERKKVAKHGYEIAHTEFNERLVTQYFLETIFDIKYSHSYRWPTIKY